MLGLKFTRTLAGLAVSHAAYDEISAALREAGYDHAFVDGMIDMNGIGLVRCADPAPQAKHRPISKNTAPGAI